MGDIDENRQEWQSQEDDGDPNGHETNSSPRGLIGSAREGPTTIQGKARCEC